MKAVFLYFMIVALVACHSKRVDTRASTMVDAGQDTAIKDDFKIFNDPSSAKFTVVFYSPASGKATLTIYFSNGTILEQRQLDVDTGENTWDFYCEATSKGIYIVRFNMYNIERSGKILKTVS